MCFFLAKGSLLMLVKPLWCYERRLSHPSVARGRGLRGGGGLGQGGEGKGKGGRVGKGSPPGASP